MAKKIQDYANTREQEQEIQKLVMKLESVCMQACEELEEEIITIENA
jgi:hypothetical protein